MNEHDGRTDGRTHLWTFNMAALGLPTDYLTPVTGAELAPCAVPHVSMVTDLTLVQAASFGGSTFVAAPTGAPHFGQTLRRNGNTIHYRRKKTQRNVSFFCLF